MIHRLLTPSNNSSFFIFGARGHGKSTFIRQQFLPQLEKSFLYYDLLDDSVEERISKNPQLIELDLDGTNRSEV